ncbi:hypothetical protein PAXRUDRAFT_180569, partial [Paxillus rubicundulus Ve08.2h10]
MDIPSHWQLHMLDIITEYMVNQFLETIGQPTQPTPALPNTSIPLSVIFKADRIVQSMAKAYKNQSITNEAREKALKERFLVEKDEELVCEPTLLLDRTGVIMAWHLPGVRVSKRDCAGNLEFLFPDISRSITDSRSWRTQEDLFTESQIRGAIELSPAWYQQGQVPYRHRPKVSAILKASHADPGPQQWLQAGALQNAILSVTLMVMHPDLYA